MTICNNRLQEFADEVRDRFGLAQFALTARSEDTIELKSLVVAREHRGQGRGTAAIQSLADFADQNGYRLFLTPGLPNRHHGTTSRARLVKFYKQVGFYENKGRRKDFSFMGGMLREPVPDQRHEPPLSANAEGGFKLG